MDPLTITPPFSYSYQCGSTLLVSYIPVYMYSVSLQLISTFVRLGIISSISSYLPGVWLRKWLSPIGWPLHLFHKLQEISHPTADSLSSPSSSPPPPSIILIKPHQIILTVINNLILLLSFGLCSPVLGCYITLATCVTLWCWMMLVGRFISYHLEAKKSTSSTSEELPGDFQPEPNPISISGLREIEQETDKSSANQTNDSLKGKDSLIHLLNSQLRGVNSYPSVCKWPVISTSCLFVTLLCWDMVGDEVGWEKGLWVPAAGVLMLLTIWLWDHFLVSKVIDLDNHPDCLSSVFSFPPHNSPPHNVTSMELTHPLLPLSSSPSQSSLAR
jgi:hypothetical protein